MDEKQKEVEYRRGYSQGYFFALMDLKNGKGFNEMTEFQRNQTKLTLSDDILRDLR